MYSVQLLYNYDQLKQGNEQLRECLTQLVDDKGVCELRAALRDATKDKRGVRR